MRSRVISQALWGLVFFLGAVSGVEAGSFAVSPVRATLSTKQSVAALMVHNDGEEPAVVQIDIDSWAQQDGHDVLLPTKEVLATPPIFTVPAGGSQVIRVGMRRAPDQHRELTYRMFLQEVPPPPRAGFQGLQVALRISIPIFILPADAKPVLAWKAIPAEHGQMKLHVTNTGNAHIQIANFKLSRSDGGELAARQVAAYVLPGASRDWMVPANIRAGETLHLFAKTDGDDIQSDVILGAP
jgi:fimbrial chaperone protein